MTTFAGSGNFGYTDGPSATASFKTPTGLATDNQGNVYVTDFGNNVIRKIDPSGTVSTFAGGSSNFNGPSGVAVDASGNVYVADQNNNQIKKVTPLGVVSIFAGSGAVGNNDGTGTNASFTSPYGVAVDAQGNVFVSDAGNSVIREISPAGNVVTFAGDGYYSLTNGIGTAAEFAYPTGITIDGQGNLFVSDLDNNAIREIRTTGFIITPALPAGLTFSTSTGVISGTPTAASPATVYTVGAYNTGGNSTFMVTITVVNALTDASLQNLTVSSGTLNPVFASAINNYAVSVPNTTSSISVT
jgi:streptogramin lyase